MVRILQEADGRLRGLRNDWGLWLEEVEALYVRWVKRIDHSPFEYHEVSCVGLLASAAALAGFLPMAEYEIRKSGRTDGRARFNGRADLWFEVGDRSYSFEVKRAFVAATENNLSGMLTAAVDDAIRIPQSEYRYCFGLLLAYVDDPDREPVYEAFAVSEAVDWAYRIGPKGKNGAYLFFKSK